MFAELAESMVDLSDQEIDDHLRALELQRRALDARMAAAIAAAEARQLNAVDSHRSMKGYLRATCNWSNAEVARFRARARAVDRLEGLGDSWYAGRIGSAQIDEFVKAHDNRRVRDHLPSCVPLLLEHAEQLPHDDFRTCVQRFVLLVDVDGSHRDIDAALDHRTAQLAVFDGSLHLTGSGGDALVNAELAAIYHRFVEHEVEADLTERRAQHGDDADAQPLPRSSGQRRYDALVAIFRSAHSAAAAGVVGSATEPLVNIVIDDATWGRMLHAAGLSVTSSLDGRPVDPFTGLSAPEHLLTDLIADPSLLRERRCETASGVALHPHQVLRAALAGHVRRVVIDPASVVVDMGRRQRLFTGAARDAAKLLAVRCVHPGCDLPADFCQVDHDHEWVDDGTTDQHNAHVRCGPHNRAKHRRRYRTRRSSGGAVHTIRADGSIMLPVGMPPPDHGGTADQGQTALEGRRDSA